jgi:hypothetical protein
MHRWRSHPPALRKQPRTRNLARRSGNPEIPALNRGNSLLTPGDPDFDLAIVAGNVETELLHGKIRCRDAESTAGNVDAAAAPGDSDKAIPFPRR